MKTTYYLMENRLLGKEVKNGEDTEYFLYEDGRWVRDERYVMFGYFLGYDPFESDDSPYAIGNLSIMDAIEEIPESRAYKIMRKLAGNSLKENDGKKE